ncbi:MAG: polysaccharide biosynthesis C-terminal domain-containing protein, partial [Anaerolineae bacterium]|nr:polysaccharide biosynthesis C-terminal domain-containing protein [Anaerolineae bacterium]
VTLDVLGTTLQYIFYVQDKPGVLRNIYLKAAVLNLVANLIAIPLFSYNGAGLTTMLTFAFIFYSLWRKTEMPFAALFDVSAMWRCAIASGIMAIWVMVTINASLAGLVIAITGGALIYGAAIVTLKVITFDELVAIPRAILRRMRRTQPA